MISKVICFVLLIKSDDEPDLTANLVKLSLKSNASRMQIAVMFAGGFRCIGATRVAASDLLAVAWRVILDAKITTDYDLEQ